MRHLLLAALLIAGTGCSLITVQQEPFPALEVRADRPPAAPPRVVLTASSITIGEKVQFATGSAEILPVSQTGQFQEITVTHDELRDPGVRRCVIDELAKLKLEKPQSARVSISYPIHFAPTP